MGILIWEVLGGSCVTSKEVIEISVNPSTSCLLILGLMKKDDPEFLH